MLLKSAVAALAAILAAILPGLSDGPMGLSEWANVVVLAAGAIQVYNAANIPGWRYAKTVAAVVTAGGVVAVSAFSDGAVSPSEWIQIGLAVANSAGVYFVPGPQHRVTA